MTEKTPQEYIIGLAKRYKEGKVSKTMFPKYSEFAFNWFSFEASNLKGSELLIYMISFRMYCAQAEIIISKPKRPLPKFVSGCIHVEGNEEVITDPKGNLITSLNPSKECLVILPKCKSKEELNRYKNPKE